MTICPSDAILQLLSISFSAASSSSLKGSSRISRSASLYKARAKMKRCLWPPLKFLPFSVITVLIPWKCTDHFVNPVIASTSFSFSWSNPLRQSNILNEWNREGRNAAVYNKRSCSNTVSFFPGQQSGRLYRYYLISAGKNPRSKLINVVFPLPDIPLIPIISDLNISRLKSVRMCLSRKLKDICSNDDRVNRKIFFHFFRL